MPLRSAPALPEIRMHAANPSAGLGRFMETNGGGVPYWAYPWAGGLALSRYLLDHPQSVAGLRVLDLGAGSGLVAIAAVKAGARHVLAVDIDPNAVAVTAINARANGVALQTLCCDMLAAPEPPLVDFIAVGDLFYEGRLADRVLSFLDCCLAQGIEVVIGDPGRRHLPLARLRTLAEVAVADFGQAEGAGRAAVYALAPIAQAGIPPHLGL